jgi:3-oxoacyl-[acyl-carrier protein] reductase
MSHTITGATLIIGAGGGIGTALCRRLHARGHTLVLASRDLEHLTPLATELGAEAHALDARDVAAVEACVQDVRGRHGRLHAAVNLAGSIVLKSAHLTSAEEWADVLATNLTSAFALVRAAAGAMSRDGGGSLVLLSSAAARVGLANHDAIAAAKAGVLGLTLSSAATYGPRGVRINAVAPGLVRTPLSARIVGNEASRKASEAMHVLGRLGEPDDVAAMIEWLVGPDSGWVTGQVFGVDGGLGTVRARG